MCWGNFVGARNVSLENVYIWSVYSLLGSSVNYFYFISTMGFEVDEDFVQELEHRPNLCTTEADGIPLIDLSLLNSPNLDDDPEALVSLVGEIGDACRDWGIFQGINHGVPLELRWRIEKAMKDFFALSAEEKKKVTKDEVIFGGYHDIENTKNIRDWKEVFDFVVEDSTAILDSHDSGDGDLHMMQNQWPDYPPQFREVCQGYAGAVGKLACKLLELISVSLGLGEKRLNGYFKDQISFVRLNHYPPCPSPHLALGLGRHKDPGAITVLCQDDVSGLEVKRKTDGAWVRVKPIPDAYIINIGDIFQVWSNDKYESPEHRVVANSERERFSIPFFFNPGHCVMVKPLEEMVNEKNPAKYGEFNCGEYFETRKNSNFKKLDVENIQIHHFKI
eukprot:TRINITY_DN1676_c0_g1_i1.p1 TRINITY_DN1676_c0_g1~~TRINITY_DN1676_c0_g1_i1.p1  ORF type:complete len:391 (-),score=57.40 TRINITY_DN1676_c0_g1_i1:688-1860(-)